MSDILNIIKERRSIRKFKTRNVDKDKINRILTAGSWAPSGLNNQPWRFIIVESLKYKNEIARLTKYGEIVKSAAVLILVFLDKESSYDRDKDIMAIGACIQNMLLEAHSLGLGSCWLGEILKNKYRVNRILNLKPRYEFLAAIVFGYPNEKSSSTREKIEDLVLAKI